MPRNDSLCYFFDEKCGLAPPLGHESLNQRIPGLVCRGWFGKQAICQGCGLKTRRLAITSHPEVGKFYQRRGKTCWIRRGGWCYRLLRSYLGRTGQLGAIIKSNVEAWSK